jgi:hypothetical protein
MLTSINVELRGFPAQARSVLMLTQREIRPFSGCETAQLPLARAADIRALTSSF